MFLCVVKCLLWARRALQHNRNIVSLNRLMMTFFPYLSYQRFTVQTLYSLKAHMFQALFTGL
uniref:Uncharacterized protein n=1 Tax=Anguilla anguilla TaxID=7936 RepID=A0A0E9WNT6_ANGAN